MEYLLVTERALYFHSTFLHILLTTLFDLIMYVANIIYNIFTKLYYYPQ